MKALVTLGLLAIATASQAQIATRPVQGRSAPMIAPLSYTYFDAQYGFSYYGGDDVRLFSDSAYKLGLNVLLAPGLYFALGYEDRKYEIANFDTNGDPAGTTEDQENEISYGLGAYYPLTPVADAFARASYTELEFEQGSLGGPSSEDKADGYDTELGVRGYLRGDTELSVSYGYAKVKPDVGSGELTRNVLNASVIVPIVNDLSLSLRGEIGSRKFEDGLDSSKEDIEAFYLGLRYNFLL